MSDCVKFTTEELIGGTCKVNTKPATSGVIQEVGILERWNDCPHNGFVIDFVARGDSPKTDKATKKVFEIANAHGCDVEMSKCDVTSDTREDFSTYMFRCNDGSLTDEVFQELLSKMCVIPGASDIDA